MLFTWDKAIDRPGGAAMTHLRRLIESRPFLSRVPDQSMVAGDNPDGIDHAQATRGDGYAFIYLPTGKPATIRLSKVGAAKVAAWWYDPRDGSATKIAELDGTADREFKPAEQGRGKDVVLVIDDASKHWGAPGAEHHAK
jgi:hypothetical protein